MFGFISVILIYVIYFSSCLEFSLSTFYLIEQILFLIFIFPVKQRSAFFFKILVFYIYFYKNKYISNPIFLAMSKSNQQSKASSLKRQSLKYPFISSTLHLPTLRSYYIEFWSKMNSLMQICMDFTYLPLWHVSYFTNCYLTVALKFYTCIFSNYLDFALIISSAHFLVPLYLYCVSRNIL